MADGVIHNHMFPPTGPQYTTGGGYGQVGPRGPPSVLQQQQQQQQYSPGQFQATKGVSNATGPWFTPSVNAGAGAENANLMYTPGQFGQVSAHPPSMSSSTTSDNDDYDNEPPLLEELGINFNHIWMKTQSVLLPNKPITEHILDDADLAGPLVFCFVFGLCLLLSAKLHFGYIYGFFVLGCFFVYMLMNLLSPEKSIDIYRVFSAMGYCLLPIIGLAAINIILSVKSLGVIGFILAAVFVIWSTYTATRFFEKALHMADQKYLIAYPVGLVFSCFVLITVF